MRIGIDLLYLKPGYSAGMESYARNLLPPLLRLDRTNEYRLFLNRDCAGQFQHLGSNVREVVLPVRSTPSGWRVLYQQSFFAFRRNLESCELLHSLGNVPAVRAPCPLVFTLHDLIVQHEHTDFSFLWTLAWQFFVKRGVKRAWVVTVSENSRRDIVHRLGVPPERVVVTPEACAPEFLAYNGSRDAEVRARYSLPARYLFFVGRLFQYKNVPALLGAYALLKDEHPDLRVVLAGRPAQGWPAIQQAIQRLGLGERVLHLGYVPEGDLPALYRQAAVFVFPSLYEGFGLPVLEAMASGTPVVCSTAASLPEVAGDAALLVNPRDPHAIADAIRRLLTDEPLSQSLVSRGKSRAAQFSWERTAAETLRLYQKVFAQHPRAG